MSGTPGGPPPPQPYSNKRLQQTQAQVDEVVDIMRVNVDKVLERDQKLSELDDRADQLQVQSRQFQTTTTRIRRKYFWQNVKMWIVIIGVVLVILVVIIEKSAHAARHPILFHYILLSAFESLCGWSAATKTVEAAAAAAVAVALQQLLAPSLKLTVARRLGCIPVSDDAADLTFYSRALGLSVEWRRNPDCCCCLVEVA